MTWKCTECDEIQRDDQNCGCREDLLEDALEEAKDMIAQLTTALEFYAETSLYKGASGALAYDAGSRALAVLHEAGKLDL